MNRHIALFCRLFLAAILLTSCLDDDNDEVTLYDDTAMTSFSIAGADIMCHTTASTGGDSIYFATAGTAVTNVAFTIDQISATVYNTDSLPKGVDVSRMLCSITTRNNGVPFIESLEPGEPTYLATTDSTDFSEPRIIRIYSSDGMNYRPYTVTVNVHKEDGDQFVWTAMETHPDFAAASALKAVALGRSVLVMAKDDTGTAIYALNESGQWEKQAGGLGTEAIGNATVRNDSLFVLDGGVLKCSVDGQTFTATGTAQGIVSLMGGNSYEMYGRLANGGIMVSHDGGASWTKDSVEYADRADSLRLASLMPVEEQACVSMPFEYSDDTDYTIWAGSRDTNDYPTDAYAKVWRKIVEYGKKERGKWICINELDENKYLLPRMEHLQTFVYNGAVMALGGKGIGGCTAEPYTHIYESRDGGITWKPSATCTFPEGLDTTAGCVTVAVDDNNYIWLVCSVTGQVWRGRLTKLGWAIHE